MNLFLVQFHRKENGKDIKARFVEKLLYHI